jgi:hypothetical protein
MGGMISEGVGGHSFVTFNGKDHETEFVKISQDDVLGPVFFFDKSYERAAKIKIISNVAVAHVHSVVTRNFLIVFPKAGMPAACEAFAPRGKNVAGCRRLSSQTHHG